jgi:drug/metabolite transporter (DMT)-like permease
MSNYSFLYDALSELVYRIDDEYPTTTMPAYTTLPSTTNSATYIKLSLVAILWGGTFIAGRVISPDIPPLVLASLRFLLAATVLALSKQGFVPINKRQMCVITSLGLTGIYTYNLFFFYGLQEINASRASLIVATNPAIMALCSYCFFKEKLSRIKACGIALCLCGTSVVIAGKSPDNLHMAHSTMRGDMLIMGCVLSWVSYSIFCKHIVRQIGALQTVTYSVIAGAIMLTITALATGKMNISSLQMLSSIDALCLLYLGVLGSALAYVMYYDAIQRIGATRAGTFIALNPLTAVIAGATLLGEQLTIIMVLGGIFIITGIILTNRSA